MIESIKPPADDVYLSPTDKGLEALLELYNPTIQSDNSITPSKNNKKLLGLLDETSTTIQQKPLPKITIPQKNIPSTDLLSKFDNQIIPNITKEEAKTLNLIEEEKRQESHIMATESDNEIILKDEDNEESIEDEEQIDTELPDKEQDQFDGNGDVIQYED